MPTPIGIRGTSNTPLPDFRSKHRIEPIPPKPHCLVADIDATFKEQVLDLPQR